MKTGWTLLFSFSFFLGCSSCGKKAPEGAPPTSPETNVVGLYRAVQNPGNAKGTQFFLVSVDKNLYSIKSQEGQYVQTHQGALAGIQFRFENGEWSSGDLVGKKLKGDEADLSDALRNLRSVNDAASRLQGEVQSDGIRVMLQLVNPTPSFRKFQTEEIEKILQDKKPFVTKMKEKMGTAFSVTDDIKKPAPYFQGPTLFYPASLVKTFSLGDSLALQGVL